MSNLFTPRLADPNSSTVREFRPGRSFPINSGWTFQDAILDGVATRTFSHHGTDMMRFSRPASDTTVGAGGWTFEPLSSGWFSVSDQSGCSLIGHAYGWTYNRVGVKQAEREGVDPARRGCGWVRFRN